MTHASMGVAQKSEDALRALGNKRERKDEIVIPPLPLFTLRIH
jgi:hypothetical protein